MSLNFLWHVSSFRSIEVKGEECVMCGFAGRCPSFVVKKRAGRQAMQVMMMSRMWFRSMASRYCTWRWMRRVEQLAQQSMQRRAGIFPGLPFGHLRSLLMDLPRYGERHFGRSNTC